MNPFPEWNKLIDGPPETDGPVIVFCPTADPKKPLTAIAWYDPLHGWSLLPETFLNVISHWMILPDRPKGTY